MYRKLNRINYSTPQLYRDVCRMQENNLTTDYCMNGDIEIIKQGSKYLLKEVYDDTILLDFISAKDSKILTFEINAFLMGYNKAVARQEI